MISLIENAYRILLIINTLIVFFLPVGLIMILVLIAKAYQNAKKIRTLTYNLQHKITSEQVNEYIHVIDKISIPHRRVYWNYLKAGYELINLEKEVDSALKEKLKRVLLSKGVIV